MGRQPWWYGLLRTSEAWVGGKRTAIGFSLILFAVIYSLLFALFIYLLNKKIVHGPEDFTLRDYRPKQAATADVYKSSNHGLFCDIYSDPFWIDYPTLWFLVVGGVFSGYAILDGFDLGAGSLHLFFKKEENRRIALNAVGPVWDGNEVWLVIGGGTLFAGFPNMYATCSSGVCALHAFWRC